LIKKKTDTFHFASLYCQGNYFNDDKVNIYFICDEMIRNLWMREEEKNRDKGWIVALCSCRILGFKT
jgi:hypothetical protein